MLSIKVGIEFVAIYCIPAISLWLAYHAYFIVSRSITKGTVSFIDRSISSYYCSLKQLAPTDKGPQFTLNWPSLQAPARRCITQMITPVFLYLTFTSADKAGLNTGIITSLFPSCIIFTSVYFYLFKGQKLTCWNLLGMALIITCIFLISFSPYYSPKDHKQHLPSYFPVGFALLSGMVTSLKSIVYERDRKYGISSLQINLDGYFIFSLFALPVYIHMAPAFDL